MSKFLVGKAGVFVVSPDTGEVQVIPKEELESYAGAGFLPASEEQANSYQKAEHYGGSFGDELAATGLGAARGLTFGGSDLLFAKTGLVPAADIKGYEEYNPAASIGSEVVGGVGSMFIGPGGALVKGATKVGEKAALAAGKALGKSALGTVPKIAGTAAKEAVIGGGFGAGSGLSRSVMDESDLGDTASMIAKTAAGGAMFAGGLGAAGAVAGVGAKKAKTFLNRNAAEVKKLRLAADEAKAKLETLKKANADERLVAEADALYIDADTLATTKQVELNKTSFYRSIGMGIAVGMGGGMDGGALAYLLAPKVISMMGKTLAPAGKKAKEAAARIIDKISPHKGMEKILSGISGVADKTAALTSKTAATAAVTTDAIEASLKATQSAIQGVERTVKTSSEQARKAFTTVGKKVEGVKQAVADSPLGKGIEKVSGQLIAMKNVAEENMSLIASLAEKGAKRPGIIGILAKKTDDVISSGKKVLGMVDDAKGKLDDVISRGEEVISGKSTVKTEGTVLKALGKTKEALDAGIKYSGKASQVATNFKIAMGKGTKTLKESGAHTAESAREVLSHGGAEALGVLAAGGGGVAAAQGLAAGGLTGAALSVGGHEAKKWIKKQVDRASRAMTEKIIPGGRAVVYDMSGDAIADALSEFDHMDTDKMGEMIRHDLPSDVDPKVADEIAARTAAAINVIKSPIPKEKGVLSRDRKPTRTETRSRQKVAEVVMRPEAFFEAIADGTVTKPMVDAFKAVYPEAHAQLNAIIDSVVASFKAEGATYTQKVLRMIGLLRGETKETKRNVDMFRGMHGQSKMQPEKQGKKLNISSNSQTRMQRIQGQ